jgi:hypothetical protein
VIIYLHDDLLPANVKVVEKGSNINWSGSTSKIDHVFNLNMCDIVADLTINDMTDSVADSDVICKRPSVEEITNVHSPNGKIVSNLIEFKRTTNSDNANDIAFNNTTDNDVCPVADRDVNSTEYAGDNMNVTLTNMDNQACTQTNHNDENITNRGADESFDDLEVPNQVYYVSLLDKSRNTVLHKIVHDRRDGGNQLIGEADDMIIFYDIDNGTDVVYGKWEGKRFNEC